MKGVIITIILSVCIISCSVCAQNSSKQVKLTEFVNKFPKRTWSDLDSIQNLNLNDMDSCDTLSIERANELIWYGNHPSQIRLKDKTTKTYYGAYLGVFAITEGWQYDEKQEDWIRSGEFSKLYPIAMVDINSNVSMFVIGYKYYNDVFDFAVDAYILNKSTQKFTSAFCLSHDGPLTILYDDMRISSYEEYEGTDGTPYVEHYVYRIASDGSLEVDESYLGISYSKGVISDIDGYVNVRCEPTAKSKILYQIPNSTKIMYFKASQSNWAEIIWIDGEFVRKGGFVHISRIR
ncbi:MAG: hypothetical protein IKR17_05865 [Bacteroidales bacterium]|nr:hypothetical protein [Bacteroidales bacterium]